MLRATAAVPAPRPRLGRAGGDQPILDREDAAVAGGGLAHASARAAGPGARLPAHVRSSRPLAVHCRTGAGEAQGPEARSTIARPAVPVVDRGAGTDRPAERPDARGLPGPPGIREVADAAGGDRTDRGAGLSAAVQGRGRSVPPLRGAAREASPAGTSGLGDRRGAAG